MEPCGRRPPPDSARRFKISGWLTREQGVIGAPQLYDAIGLLAGLKHEPVQTALLTRIRDPPVVGLRR